MTNQIILIAPLRKYISKKA